MTALGRATDNNVGFGYSIDACTARRQLNLSLGVVLVLAVAIVTAVLSLNVRPVSARGYVVSVPSVTQQAQRIVPAVRS